MQSSTGLTLLLTRHMARKTVGREVDNNLIRRTRNPAKEKFINLSIFERFVFCTQIRNHNS